MYGPIGMGFSGKGQVDWRNLNALCKKLLGYVPIQNTKLNRDELDKLGFKYAAKTRKFTSSVYGHVSHLL
jgi:hypothetical protein